MIFVNKYFTRGVTYIFTAVCVLGIGVNQLNAQTLKPSPKPKADPFALQLEMAESAFAITKDLAARTRVISLYERILPSTCGRDKTKCASIIEKLLQLDNANVPAVCEKFGIISAECREVSNAQELGWYDIDAARWRSLSGQQGGALDSSDLGSAIAIKRNKPKVDQLIALREKYIRIPHRQTVEEQALDAVLTEGLALTCTNPKIVFIAPKIDPFGLDNDTPEKADIIIHEADPTAGPSVTKTGTSPLDSVIDDLKGKAIPTPNVQPTLAPSRLTSNPAERLKRIRLLSRECYDFVRTATALRPAMIQARCARDGWYAPSCRAETAFGVKDGIDSF